MRFVPPEPSALLDTVLDVVPLARGAALSRVVQLLTELVPLVEPPAPAVSMICFFVLDILPACSRSRAHTQQTHTHTQKALAEGRLRPVMLELFQSLPRASHVQRVHTIRLFQTVTEVLGGVEWSLEVVCVSFFCPPAFPALC